MRIRKINQNHYFVDVTPGDHRGYDWELYRVVRNDEGIEKFIGPAIGGKRDDETFSQAARRLGIEPTYRDEKVARMARQERAIVSQLQQQTRRVSQGELDLVGGIDNYRRDIDPHRRIVVVATGEKTGVVAGNRLVR